MGKLHMKLTKHGHPTKYFILDNECSRDLKAALTKHDNKFELTPSNMHCRNAAECAIHTYKNHVLSGLATCDPAFPVSEWDCIFHQSTITLNLLCSSRVNPNYQRIRTCLDRFISTKHHWHHQAPRQ